MNKIEITKQLKELGMNSVLERAWKYKYFVRT